MGSFENTIKTQYIKDLHVYFCVFYIAYLAFVGIISYGITHSLNLGYSMNATILLHAKRIGYACVLNLLAEIIVYCNWNWVKIS